MLEKLRTTGLLIVPLVLYSFRAIQTSWAGDDAYITMRTVNNFIHGHDCAGTWMSGVPVHPLDVPLTPVQPGEPAPTLIGLSITLSVVTFILLLALVPRSNFSLLLAGMILIFSKAYIDYSTSGLENPATHLLLLIFCIVALGTSLASGKRILILSLLAGLLLLNRMDSPAVLPTWLYTGNRSRTLTLFLAGMSPSALGNLSLIYYDFFPEHLLCKLDSAYRSVLIPGASISSIILLEPDHADNHFSV
jgi:arabinofuranosyltransferase